MIYRKLTGLEWSPKYVETDVDKLFSRFYNKLNKLINKSKMFSKPWITRGLRKSIRIKNKLLSLGNKDQYKY